MAPNEPKMVSKNVKKCDGRRPCFWYLPQVAPKWSQDVILELPRALLRPLCCHLEVLEALGSHFGSPNRLLGCPDGAQDVISELPGGLWRPFCRHFWTHLVAR